MESLQIPPLPLLITPLPILPLIPLRCLHPIRLIILQQLPQQLLISLLIFRPKLHKNRFTDLQSTFEFPAVDVLLDRSLFLGDFDACQSAE